VLKLTTIQKSASGCEEQSTEENIWDYKQSEKFKAVPLHGVKAYWGVEIRLYTSLISELGEIEWTPLSWYTLNRRLDEFQSRCGHFGKETFFLPFPGINGCPSHHLVAKPTKRDIDIKDLQIP
jgi:hypothetical protein